MSELVDKTLGKYHIITRLGRGGMADVYQAYQPRLDRYVALKVLHNHLAEEDDFISRFEREPAAIARLRHPNIVQVFDFDVEGELYYMVMELIAGPTLKTELKERHLNNQPFTLAETTQIFTALSSAIDYAHIRGMVHHDLKPGNIMFTNEGEVVLTDFGLARIVGAEHHTATGSVYGTPAYMAPEQAQGERGDGRSDIYSLGIILYEMVTGRTPFEADTPFKLIMQHVNESPPPPATINPDLPKTVEQVIIKTLSKNPDDRYPRAGELAQALREAVGMTSEAILTASPITIVAPPPRIEETSITPTPQPSTPATPPKCPYRGLYAFQEEDASFFFGREAFTEQLVAAAHNQPMVAVIGPSGSGKSSVVFAGLVAQLRQEETWLVATFRPGSRPFQTLAAGLIPLLEPDLSETDRLVETRKLAEALSRGDVPLYEAIDRSLDKHPEANRLLLVADQFEELYTLCPDQDLRHRFLDMLLEVVDIQQFRKTPSFTFALTLRVDFLGQALTHRPFADALQDADVKLGPMTRQELGRAIANPARKQRIVFETGLVARILDDVGDEPGNLPLLEFALTALWERMVAGRLTHAAYEAIGQVEGALARYADDVFDNLGSAEQNAARRIFIQMVRPGEGTEDTRRLAIRTELSEADWQLVQQLADARLVVTGQDPAGQETVEVVHEALIRGWHRLREWMAEDRVFRVWQERLRAALNQWQASGQDDGALLRGVPLAEAENWLAEREADLSQAERDFVEASLAARRQREEARRAQQDRERTLEQSALRRLRVIVAVLVAASIAGISLTLIIFNQSQTNRQIAEQAQAASTAAIVSQATAEAERDQTQINLSRQLAALALTQLEDQLDLALLLGLEATQIANTIEARSTFRTLLAAKPEVKTFLRSHADSVNSVAFSPDGQILASGSNDNTIRLWDVASGQSLGPPLMGHTEAVRSLAFSPDGQTLASGSDDTSIMLWDVTSRQPIGNPLVGHKVSVGSVVFSPDGQTLASSSDETIILWDISTALNTGVATHQPLSEPLIGHTDWVRTLAFSSDGQMLASGSWDGTIILWNVATGQPLDDPLAGHTDAVWSVAFSSDGQILASGSDDNTIILWDVATGQPLGEPLSGHTDAVNSVTFSADGQTLISASDDTTILLWDVTTGQPLDLSLTDHTAPVRSVASSPDDQTIASGSEDGTIILWNITKRRLDPTALGPPLNNHSGAVLSVAFSPDGQILASGSRDKTIILWDVAGTEESGVVQPLGPPLTGHAGTVRSVVFSPDGRTLASGSEDNTVILWDTASGQSLGPPLTGHTDWVMNVAFSPDGQVLASAGGDSNKTIILWDVATGQPIGSPLTGHTAAVTSLAFSPDGQTLASTSWDSTIIFWDVVTRRPLGQPADQVLPLFSAVLSPDGRSLASISTDDTVILWDVATRQPLGSPLRGSGGAVTGSTGASVAFSPDGLTLASTNLDRTINLWDVTNVRTRGGAYRLGSPLAGHTEVVNSVAFSPDGQTLASGSNDGTIILWDVGEESGRTRACRRANRNLTREEWQQLFGDQPYRPTCPNLPVPEE